MKKKLNNNMKVKQIRWERHKSRPILRGYIKDKLVAMIMEDPKGDCVHFTKFYEERWNRKNKTFRVHKNTHKAIAYIQELFEDFVRMCVEEEL